jgi:hypothetical protein
VLEELKNRNRIEDRVTLVWDEPRTYFFRNGFGIFQSICSKDIPSDNRNRTGHRNKASPCRIAACKVARSSTPPSFTKMLATPIGWLM